MANEEDKVRRIALETILWLLAVGRTLLDGQKPKPEAPTFRKEQEK